MTIALITGAAGGLGTAVARRLAAGGRLVALNDLPGRDVAGLAAELNGVAAPADVSDPDAVTAMVAEVERRTGGQIALLVTCASRLEMAPFTGAEDLEGWWRTIDIDLGGTFACAQAVMPGMVERGGGRMVFTASEWGVIGWPDASAYSASKGGVIALAKSLGLELAPLGIAVNAVAPGAIDTPLLEVDAAAAGVSAEEIRARYAAQAPLGRIATPEEVAAAVAFLADERLPTLVGQILHVNGGTTRARA
ncbi:NAD(P)-dependent dehydrogenase (short-subunit alcohol dehydrogenase family) [Actinomadura luteofluorescens]|uniref:NAD(P)-dependent dehydrogenase (Short-subunit alcohol dehydrogenase family) n=1 Tax=Actinomadura luteofluorescens TaxID=46163 RepID=A0A7Y9EKZ2_9ACTN|nr:SDR family oxidoreductase [Actinomadura luteofluorescens]NYD49676.1 NAD(P)-dependent dehydrogenase (short-subunit alcohol dehydrogenase family) [Actinomadura luteofluorescens]